jgi:site-specific recombinase XerD
MLEHFYKDPRALVDFRRGPLGPYFDDFAAQLKKSGYVPSTGQQILGHCCIFNAFLIEHGIGRPKEITPALADAFMTAYFAHNQSRTRCIAESFTRCHLKHLFDYLIMKGAMKAPVVKPTKKPYSWMLDPYLRYLREERQLARPTIQRIEDRIHAFLSSLKTGVTRNDVKSLKAEQVEAHVKEHLKCSRENLINLANNLRGFLRFCAQKGYTNADLSLVIPSIPSYRLRTLPKGMEETAIQKILGAVPQGTAVGSRDYGILLLLVAYGIRGKQAAELVLDDINWPRSTIRFRAMKGGKEVILPLMDAVGEAILSYLRHRPESLYRQVFLTSKAPYRPLTGLAVSRIVHAAMEKAHVEMRRGGTNTFRHSWAIRALAHDSPMKAIADVLGHRCLDTTFIYAKADLKALRQVAMPWPGGRQ